jgi:hypothetical protein
MRKGYPQNFFALPTSPDLVVKYKFRRCISMGKDARPIPEPAKRGWWTRFLEKLAKANKEALQQGCKG